MSPAFDYAACETGVRAESVVRYSEVAGAIRQYTSYCVPQETDFDT
jgi:hypothetical protein